MTKTDKKLLYKQKEVYLVVGGRFGTVSDSYEEPLDKFIEQTSRIDWLDVTDEEVETYVKSVYTRRQHWLYIKDTQNALDGIRGFYMARSKNAKKRDKVGRPPYVDQIQRAQELREKYKELSLTELGAVLNPKKPVDKSQVWRMLRYRLNIFR